MTDEIHDINTQAARKIYLRVLKEGRTIEKQWEEQIINTIGPLKDMMRIMVTVEPSIGHSICMYKIQ